MITTEESFGIIQKLLVSGFETNSGKLRFSASSDHSALMSWTNSGTNYESAISCPGLEDSHFGRLGTIASDPCSFAPEER